jgi:hypothetical protein
VKPSAAYGNDGVAQVTAASQPCRLLFGWVGWRNTILFKLRALKWRQIQSGSITEALFTLMTHSLAPTQQRQEVTLVTLETLAKCRPSLRPAFSNDVVCVCALAQRERERERDREREREREYE